MQMLLDSSGPCDLPHSVQGAPGRLRSTDWQKIHTASEGHLGLLNDHKGNLVCNSGHISDLRAFGYLWLGGSGFG